MLKITVDSYDETVDQMYCTVVDDIAGCTYVIDIHAALIPYIAEDLCEQIEDLPTGLVGKTFVLRSRLCDMYGD